MQPRLAFSTNAYKRTDFASAATDIAARGYKALEVFADVPHLDPLAATESDIEKAKSHLKRLGLKISNVNAFTMYRWGDTWNPSFLDPDPQKRKLRIDHTVAALHMAHKLGAATVSTEPAGALPSGMTRKSAIACFADSLAEILERTDALDTLLLIEPEPGLLFEHAHQLDELFELIADPRIAMNLDIGHFYCVGEDPARIITDYCGRFDHIHLEDIAADRKHLHLVPGDGAIDFQSVFKAISDIGYDGYVTIELYPFEDDPGKVATRALEHLTPIWREVFGADPA